MESTSPVNGNCGSMADVLCAALEAQGCTLISGVPCSYFAGVIERATRENSFRYLAAAHEGVALAIAAGAALAGRRSVVLLQNSGFGNLLNPLTSLSLNYRIPVLLMISMRGFPDPAADEPQHSIMGESTTRILDLLSIPYFTFPASPAAPEKIVERAFLEGISAILMPDPLGKDGQGRGTRPEASGLSSTEVIRAIVDLVGPQVPIISTTGGISRSLFNIADRESNFYMQGSMGHAGSIGLGICMGGFRSSRVVILDGDGAAIMHMGAMSTIGHYGVDGLLHIILDNEAYSSTGNQPTTSTTTDLSKVALACGYSHVRHCQDRADLPAVLDEAFKLSGPVCLLIKISRSSAELPARITTKYTAEDVRARFERVVQTASTREC